MGNEKQTFHKKEGREREVDRVGEFKKNKIMNFPYYTQTGNVMSEEDASTFFGKYALFGTIGFAMIVHFWESYLDSRQIKSYQITTFPKQLEITVTNIDKERAEAKKQQQGEEKKDDKEEEEKKEDDGDENSKDKVDPNAPLLPQLRSKF